MTGLVVIVVVATLVTVTVKPFNSLGDARAVVGRACLRLDWRGMEVVIEGNSTSVPEGAMAFKAGVQGAKERKGIRRLS